MFYLTIDLLGLSSRGKEDPSRRENSLKADKEEERIVVSQDPGNTLDVLKSGWLR